MNRRELLKSGAAISGLAKWKGPEPLLSLFEEAGSRQERFVAKAAAATPQLASTRCALENEVEPVADEAAYLRWDMRVVGDRASVEKKLLKTGDTIWLDFGKHVTGYFKFDIDAVGTNIDAPARLRLTFGEVPGDVAEPLYPYSGTLAESWLPDEVYNLDPLPRSFEVPRRHAFRYVRIDVISVSAKYAVRFRNCEVQAVSSATAHVAPLGPEYPQLAREIDRASLDTLHDCMQTVFEDGPRRDQRLWIGDLRLQALANYATFGNHDLVKRSLYLLAAFPQPDGLLHACVFEKPVPKASGDTILDYAAIYAIALCEYMDETGDLETVRDLWPTAHLQMQLLSKYVNEEGLFADPHTLWVFIDWEQKLHRDAAMQGVLICSLQSAQKIAGRLGFADDASTLRQLADRMTAAGRKQFYDPEQKLFVSGPEKQLSWASQAWLTLASVLPQDECAEVLRAAARHSGMVLPATPYLYHYVVEAMASCGLNDEADRMIAAYWGGMVRRGADTFWEVYDPNDSRASPYKDVHINSFCHAWSCTPTYFFRRRGLGRSREYGSGA